MEQNNVYFIKISGTVSAVKQREFQQTVQFVFNQLPSDCMSSNLSLDVHIPELNHLFSLWKSEKAVRVFEESNEYQLLKGAFQTLGSYKGAMVGKWVDIQSFELDQHDN
jgi:hypothetical protein